MPTNTLPRVVDSLKMIDENTVELKYADHVTVNVDDMRELLDQLYDFTNNRKVKRLIVISKNATMELPARLLLQQENKDRKDSISAEAVVVNSLTQKMTTNFYLKFIKDIYPSRFFTDYEKAKEWLRIQNHNDY